jgi:heme exporter protein CcmD
MMGDPHFGFIVAAYAVATATIAAMIGWVVLDAHRLNAELARVTRALDGVRDGAKGASQ